MIKTYCDICGEEITSLDKARQYKIKKLELSLPYSLKFAERRAEHADHT